MGLAAGQARLLTITARKSDCEYQSMRLSHQKIALSRQLADLSNEYQNSLDQTKLIYDYYGTGDESTPLSYGLLMTPSALNEYMPIFLTDKLGRVTLNSKYAAAARAAGIPQEGLGTLSSEKMRNTFIQALAGEGLITDQLATTIQSVEYNQGAGFGDNVSVVYETISGNLTDLKKYLNDNYEEKFVFSKSDITITEAGKGSGVQTEDTEISFSDLLSNENELVVILQTQDGQEDVWPENRDIATYVINHFIPELEKALGSALNYNEQTQAAFDYAKNTLINTFFQLGDGGSIAENIPNTQIGTGKKKDPGQVNSALYEKDQDYIGCVWYKNKQGATKWGKNFNSGIAINLNNIAQAYLTYFVDKMNGVNTVGADGKDVYNVNPGLKSNSNLVDDQYQFTIYTGTTIASDDIQLAAYYDTIFNKICANGWTENNNIEDNKYLQNMLQSGMLFISKVKDDGYYYQGNYATDSYIKEISDETLIAQAEAKYNTEKAKLNSKEETLDLKMKNLDTEISSLTTEYDTVKNTISKNIEKSFKRYDA